MLAPMAIEKGGPLACLAHDLRHLSNDQDLVAVCLFASLGLTAALTLAFCGRRRRRLGWTLW